jgi:hypothetical protein
MEARERGIYLKPDEKLHAEIIADLIKVKNEIEFKKKKLDFESKFFFERKSDKDLRFAQFKI